eukprot:TRINITY_DN9175_c0_g1_i1.p1 TRINITY_DN9175_c0_g1~~TRINITY_DN9175_c0_g1_i1.p1  ORF type:complete len:214 (-),score=30.11 TRINITY_DN9175_c0_g1_i1:877-1518(-)
MSPVNLCSIRAIFILLVASGLFAQDSYWGTNDPAYAYPAYNFGSSVKKLLSHNVFVQCPGTARYYLPAVSRHSKIIDSNENVVFCEGAFWNGTGSVAGVLDARYIPHPYSEIALDLECGDYTFYILHPTLLPGCPTVDDIPDNGPCNEGATGGATGIATGCATEDATGTGYATGTGGTGGATGGATGGTGNGTGIVDPTGTTGGATGGTGGTS